MGSECNSSPSKGLIQGISRLIVGKVTHGAGVVVELVAGDAADVATIGVHCVDLRVPVFNSPTMLLASQI